MGSQLRCGATRVSITQPIRLVGVVGGLLISSANRSSLTLRDGCSGITKCVLADRYGRGLRSVKRDLARPRSLGCACEHFGRSDEASPGHRHLRRQRSFHDPSGSIPRSVDDPEAVLEPPRRRGRGRQPLANYRGPLRNGRYVAVGGLGPIGVEPFVFPGGGRSADRAGVPVAGEPADARAPASGEGARLQPLRRRPGECKGDRGWPTRRWSNASIACHFTGRGGCCSTLHGGHDRVCCTERR